MKQGVVSTLSQSHEHLCMQGIKGLWYQIEPWDWRMNVFRSKASIKIRQNVWVVALSFASLASGRPPAFLLNLPHI